MSHPVERYSVDDLLSRRSEIRVMAPKLGPVPVHWHDFYELCYVVSGDARHVVNGVESQIRRGSAFLLSPVDFHEITPTEGTVLECYNVVVGPALVERQLDALLPGNADWQPWAADGLDDLEPVFERLEREGAGSDPGRELAMNSALTWTFVELARRSGAVSRTGEPAGRSTGGDDVRRAIAYVERHFREPLTLADAARVAHLSPNYFSERFREATGTPFQAYLQNRRLQFGRSLLASTSLSVADVCHASGFNSLSHFGRAYRRRYGEPPSRTIAATSATSRSHIDVTQSARFS
jgi:AraC-like DNA-binding protein